MCDQTGQTLRCNTKPWPGGSCAAPTPRQTHRESRTLDGRRREGTWLTLPVGAGATAAIGLVDSSAGKWCLAAGDGGATLGGRSRGSWFLRDGLFAGERAAPKHFRRHV